MNFLLESTLKESACNVKENIVESFIVGDKLLVDYIPTDRTIFLWEQNVNK